MLSRHWPRVCLGTSLRFRCPPARRHEFSCNVSPQFPLVQFPEFSLRPTISTLTIHPSSDRRRLTRATAAVVQTSLWGADQRTRDGYNQVQTYTELVVEDTRASVQSAR